MLRWLGNKATNTLRPAVSFLELPETSNFLEQIDHQAGRLAEALAHYVPWSATPLKRDCLDVKKKCHVFPQEKGLELLKIQPEVPASSVATLLSNAVAWPLKNFDGPVKMIHDLVCGGHCNPSSVIESQASILDRYRIKSHLHEFEGFLILWVT